MDAIIAMAVGTVPAERTTLKVWTRFSEHIMQAIQELRNSQEPTLPLPSMRLVSLPNEPDMPSANDAVTAASINMLSENLSSTVMSRTHSSPSEADTPVSLAAPTTLQPTSPNPVPATSPFSPTSQAPTTVRASSRASSCTRVAPVAPSVVSPHSNLTPSQSPTRSPHHTPYFSPTFSRHASPAPIRTAHSPRTPHLASSLIPHHGAHDLSPTLEEKVGASRSASAAPTRPACSPSTSHSPPTEDATHIPQHDASGVENATVIGGPFEGDLSDTERGDEQGPYRPKKDDASSQQVSRPVVGKAASKGKVSPRWGYAKLSPVKKTAKGKHKVN